ncbi:MAG: hypothetical protein IIZ83_10045, partial [Oscillospiraceae bacterium]|nr:hypothetical protein [Oscillospiraceae bacterium]
SGFSAFPRIAEGYEGFNVETIEYCLHVFLIFIPARGPLPLVFEGEQRAAVLLQVLNGEAPGNKRKGV